MEFTPPSRTEEEYLSILNDRIIECICHKLVYENMSTFHGVDMIRECARGFFDKAGADQYQFSGEHPFYRLALEKFCRPLVKHGLIQENENNNFTIPADSRLHEICRKELTGKVYIGWKDFSSKYLT
jgi:hypothetical protein